MCALGLQHHHSLTQTLRPLSNRDPLHAKVIYHADGWTLYAQPPPKLALVPKPVSIQEDPLEMPVAVQEGPSEEEREPEDIFDNGMEPGPVAADDVGRPDAEVDARKSLETIWRDHLLIQNLLTKYLVQHLQSCFVSAGGYFGISLRPRHAFQSLSKKLFPSDAAAENLEQVVLNDNPRGELFCGLCQHPPCSGNQKSLFFWSRQIT